MAKIYFTLTGTKHYFGDDFLRRGMRIELEKEPDNKYDREAIMVKAEGLGKIGYVANEPFTPSRKEFLNGVKQALYDRRLRWKNIRKSPMVNASWQSSLDAGYYGTLPLLQEHPEVTAIFYDTCPGAQAGLAALNELGRRCPDEISVIATSCFCGSENYTIPALTTVSYPARVLMDRAIEIILMPEKKFPERSLTPPELHRRASVRNLML